MLDAQQQIDLLVQVGKIQEGNTFIVSKLAELDNTMKEGFREAREANTEFRKDLNVVENVQALHDARIRKLEMAELDRKNPKLHPLIVWSTIGSALLSSVSLFGLLYVLAASTTTVN